MNSKELISKDDAYLMAQGEWFRSYQKLGAHVLSEEGQSGYRFCVWAPHVQKVSVVGDFNNWDKNAHQLISDNTGRYWTCVVPEAQAGQFYKYCIVSKTGEQLMKADPYAFWSECPPGTASRLIDETPYQWGDFQWMEQRKEFKTFASPLNIYEVHLGSWKRHAQKDSQDGEYNQDFLTLNYTEDVNDIKKASDNKRPILPEQVGEPYSYRELSTELVDYAVKMGYTHIELLPIMEHPFDGSWGYQLTAYYAVTSRYGTPAEFMAFIDACHQAGLGVILDWVPGGFCRDEQGLSRFNGESLFERKEHPQWGTFTFNFKRGEVRSFLISNVLWWLEHYHVDGIRVDGVTSMLYLNFGIEDKLQKVYNEKGGEEDLAAIAFLQRLNEVVGSYHPDVLMIAEESTSWPLVTRPPYEGG